MGFTARRFKKPPAGNCEQDQREAMPGVAQRHGEEEHGMALLSVGQFGPIRTPIGAQITARYAGVLFDGATVVRRSYPTCAPVGNGLGGFTESLRECSRPPSESNCFSDWGFSDHATNVHATCSSSQRSVFPAAHNLCMTDTVWHRIDRELTRRKDARQQPGSWAELGRLIQASAQKMTNWKSRGVPPKEYADIALALGWSVDQLLGLAETSQALAPPPLPPRDFKDRREVSDSDWGLLEDVKLVLSDQEISDIRARAQRLKEHAERYYRPNLTVVSNPLSQELKSPVIQDRSSPVHDKALGALEAAQIDPPVKGKNEQEDRKSGRSTRPRHRGGP